MSYKKIIFPQVFLLSPKIIRNPWLFFPICIVFLPYNCIAMLISIILFFLVFGVFFLKGILKKIIAK
tara:strand:- start:71 stop:271 length:201 start_codon:yes stop_codon:yes gene_type:complete